MLEDTGRGRPIMRMSCTMRAAAAGPGRRPGDSTA
jgi:hypothetical protein